MSARMSRRQVYAFVTLADAPPPYSIKFAENNSVQLALSFDKLSELMAWNKLLDGPPVTSRPSVSTNGTSLSHFLEWGGYHVMLWANEPAVLDEPVDEATRAQLQQLAAQEVVTGPAALVDDEQVQR